MIPRYSRAPMTEIWSDTNKYKIWLDIELFACEAMEQLGTVPKGTAKKVRSKAKININRIDKIEREVKHDVIAFLTSVAEHAGPPARFLHQGLTSSDVLDTAFNFQLNESAKLIEKELNTRLKAIKTIGFSKLLFGAVFAFGEPSWCPFGSYGRHLTPILASCWGHFGILLGSCLDHFGITLGSCWDQFGISLGCC